MAVESIPSRETRSSDADLPLQEPAGCQLQVLMAGTTPADVGIRLRSRALRIGSYIRDHLGEAALRMARMRAKSLQSPRPSWTVGDLVSPEVGRRPIREGDRVRVLPMPGISETLDKDGRCDGLRFMKGMEEYCGQTFTVLRRVQAIFDEREWQMRRIRDTVLLEGVICKGWYMGDREGCDRCCFFFWKEQWLCRV